MLRKMLNDAIALHVDEHRLPVLRTAEEEEREGLAMLRWTS